MSVGRLCALKRQGLVKSVLEGQYKFCDWWGWFDCRREPPRCCRRVGLLLRVKGVQFSLEFGAAIATVGQLMGRQYKSSHTWIRRLFSVQRIAT